MDKEIKQIKDEEGNLLGEMHYRNGIADGKCQLWYKNGQLHQESNYSEGILNGTYRSWWDNGLPKEETEFVHGAKKSSKHFDVNGELVSEYPS